MWHLFLLRSVLYTHKNDLWGNYDVSIQGRRVCSWRRTCPRHLQRHFRWTHSTQACINICSSVTTQQHDTTRTWSTKVPWWKMCSQTSICHSDPPQTSHAHWQHCLLTLMTVITEKDTRIDKLESQINDLEQNSKKKNIIITRLNLHTYATTLTNATTTGHSTQHLILI